MILDWTMFWQASLNSLDVLGKIPNEQYAIDVQGAADANVQN